MWAILLREWQRRFGFEGLVYVDLANEVPYFLPGFLDRIRIKDETGAGPVRSRLVPPLDQMIPSWPGAQLGLGLLQREFPSLRFTASIHGDLRWLDIPVQFDCLDVHFYADADPRWATAPASPNGCRAYSPMQAGTASSPIAAWPPAAR